MNQICSLLILVVYTLLSDSAAQRPGDTEWRPPRQPQIYLYGHNSHIFTPAGLSWRDAWYDVEDRNSITFSLRACENAILQLSSGHVIIDEETTTLSLGLNGNKISRLSNTETGEVYDETETAGYLNCHEIRYFWIEWRRGWLLVGLGDIVGERMFLYREIVRDGNINSIGFGSDHQDGAHWNAHENTGSILHIYTKGDTEYKKFFKSVRDRVSIHFKVKACSDAMLLLSSDRHDFTGKVYEFVIGINGNTEVLLRTSISSDEEYIQARVTKAALDCEQYRNFWVSWNSGSIKIGTGVLYNDAILLEWYDEALRVDVQYFTVMSTGENEAHWRIGDDLQTVTTMITPAHGPKPLAWIDSPRTSFMTFSVQACQQLTIQLSEEEGRDGEYGYEIDLYYIKGDGFYSGIKQKGSSDYIVERPTSELINCHESKDFWISWRSSIEIGSGKAYGYYSILDTGEIDEDFQVQSLGFYSPAGGEAEWSIPESAGDVFKFWRQGNADPLLYTSNWRTVKSRRDFTFQVEACGHAHIALAYTVGMSTYQNYIEIIIGAEMNNKTVILQHQGPGHVEMMAATDTFSILHCNEMRDFWVSWDNGLIEVGRGLLPGQRVIAGSSNPLLHPIQAFSFDSSHGDSSVWYFPEDVGDMAIIGTNGTLSYQHLMYIEPYQTWVSFSVQACRDAHVTIASSRVDLDADAVDIAIGTGGNAISSMTSVRYGLVDNSTSLAGTLSCANTRTFWLSWNKGLIQFGEGTSNYFHPPFLQWLHPGIFAVEGLSFATDETEGLWYWKQSAVPFGEFKTSGNHNEMPLIARTLWHHRNLEFSVKACSNVQLIFSNRVGVASNSAYRLVIGTNNNKDTTIEQFYLGAHVLRNSTPGLLHCDVMKSFWVSWERNTLEVGAGEVLGWNQIIAVEGVLGSDIESVAFGTIHGVAGVWKIPMYEAYWGTNVTRVIPEKESNSSSMSAGEVAGTVIGVLLLVALLGVVAVSGLVYMGYMENPISRHRVPDLFVHTRFRNDNLSADILNTPYTT